MTSPTLTHAAYVIVRDIKTVMDALPAFMAHRDHKAVHNLAERAFAAGFAEQAHAIHRAGQVQIGDDVRIALGEIALGMVEP